MKKKRLTQIWLGKTLLKFKKAMMKMSKALLSKVRSYSGPRSSLLNMTLEPWQVICEIAISTRYMEIWTWEIRFRALYQICNSCSQLWWKYGCLRNLLICSLTTNLTKANKTFPFKSLKQRNTVLKKVKPVL